MIFHPFRPGLSTFANYVSTNFFLLQTIFLGEFASFPSRRLQPSGIRSKEVQTPYPNRLDLVFLSGGHRSAILSTLNSGI